MNVIAKGTLVTLSLTSLLGCGGPVDSPGDAWIGDVVHDGTTTTVYNKSGSLWADDGRFVETLSIGVEAGASEYMFGPIASIWETEDRIYVVDGGVDIVRVYDAAGQFIRNLAPHGPGPAEYLTPSLLAVASDGRVFVYDSTPRAVKVYSPDGEFIEQWSMPKFRCCAWRMTTSADGVLWVPVSEASPSRESRSSDGVQGVRRGEFIGAIRSYPEIDFERVVRSFEGFQVGVPYGPRKHVALTYSGDLVAGASDRYRFEVHRRDGTTLVVHKSWTAVPVESSEAVWLRRWMTSRVRTNFDPNWTPDVEIPAHKPAFSRLLPAQSGEIWVLRLGPSKRVDDCIRDPLDVTPAVSREKPCWESERFFDIFDRRGRLLGSFPVPPGVQPDQTRLFIKNRSLLAVAEDAAGVIQIKRFAIRLYNNQHNYVH